MDYTYIIYLLYKLYDIWLTIYFNFIKNYNIIYKFVNKKIYKSTNIIYIFSDSGLISKHSINNFNKIIDFENSKDKDFFIIHEIENSNKTYVSNNIILDNDNIKNTSYTFILVEIINSTSKIDITKFLNNTTTSYYINDNNLFDKNFMIWLKYNGFHLDSNYKIKIIDNNINSIELDKNNYIKLLENSYNIIEI